MSMWKLLVPMVLMIGSCGDLLEPILLVDSSCAEILCGWETAQGSLSPAASWHKHQRAIQLTGVPARISKRIPGTPNIDCLSMGLLAEVGRDAQLELQVDFNDDGSIDARSAVPEVEWRHIDLGLRAPPEYRSVRVTLDKRGPGTVRITSLILSSVPAHCGPLPTRLADGALCSANATCASNRCTFGKCTSCAAGGCAEGEACLTSDECRDGACAAGKCLACAKQGRCAAGTGCSVSGQCAAGSCVLGGQPGLSSYPGVDGVCGDCDADQDCGSGYCVRGRCSACRDNADCTGGTVCRYADTFDVSRRSCLPPITSTAPRGALCESSADCLPGLRCDGSPDRAPRCGVACLTDAECGSEALCAAPGVSRAVDPPALFALLPTWSSVPARIATCYPKLDSALLQTACEVQEQCPISLGTACCGGKCMQATLDPDTAECTAFGPLSSW